MACEGHAGAPMVLVIRPVQLPRKKGHINDEFFYHIGWNSETNKLINHSQTILANREQSFRKLL